MRVPIPFLDSSTALWLLSRHECFVYYFRFFHRACGFEQWVGATLAQLLGSASQDVRLCVRGIVVTVSVRFCGGGIDSFLGFEYGIDYSRVARVRVLLTFLTTSLRYLRILPSLGVTWCDTPSFLAYPHVFLTCGPFIGFLGFFGVCQSYSCVGVDRQDDYSADSSASLAQCGFVGGFFTNFALVSDHLRNFSFYSWASLLVLFFFCSAWLFSSLSLLWWLALGVLAAGHLLWWSLFFVFGEFYFCSSGAVFSSSSC